MATSAAQMNSLTHQMVATRYARAASRTDKKMLYPPLFLFIGLVLQLWVRISTIDRGFEIEQLRKAALENDTRLRNLRLEYALATSPAALTEYAETKLSMVTLPPQRMRKVN